MERWFDRTGGRVRSRSRKWFCQRLACQGGGRANRHRDPANRTDMLKDGWKSVGSASPLQRAEKRRIHMNLSDGRSS
jgi:hypothetical protein